MPFQAAWHSRYKVHATDFFTNRHQKVLLGNAQSSLAAKPSVVPQGTILVSILFTLMIYPGLIVSQYHQ